MSKKLMPKCLGHYDVGDEVCDGDPSGETEEDKMSCVFRDRCAALKQHCEHKGFQPEQFVKIRKVEDDDGERRAYAVAKGDDEQFAQQLAKWSKRWGISNGRVTKKSPDDSKPPKTGGKKKKPARSVKDRPAPTAEARKKAKAAVAEKAEESLGQAYEMCSWFTKCLQEATGRKVADIPEAAEPGELFVIDRMEKSRYASVYCRKGRSGKVAVAVVLPHTRSSTCQIRLPAEADVVEATSEGEKLGVASINDGKFKARTKKLDKEGMATAADVVARLVKGGTIELPAE